MIRAIVLMITLFISSVSAIGQEMTVDTTDAQYQIGKQIGGWLPVVFILVLAVIFIRHTYRFRNDKGNIDFD